MMSRRVVKEMRVGDACSRKGISASVRLYPKGRSARCLTLGKESNPPA